MFDKVGTYVGRYFQGNTDVMMLSDVTADLRPQKVM